MQIHEQNLMLPIKSVLTVRNLFFHKLQIFEIFHSNATDLSNFTQRSDEVRVLNTLNKQHTFSIWINWKITSY